MTIYIWQYLELWKITICKMTGLSIVFWELNQMEELAWNLFNFHFTLFYWDALYVKCLFKLVLKMNQHILFSCFVNMSNEYEMIFCFWYSFWYSNARLKPIFAEGIFLLVLAFTNWEFNKLEAIQLFSNFKQVMLMVMTVLCLMISFNQIKWYKNKNHLVKYMDRIYFYQ